MKNLKILVVDDIFINRLLLAEIINELNFYHEEVENGKEAIEKLQHGAFDIVLMDIEMPVMNGLETTKYIREKLSYPLNKIPVIALTAHNPSQFFDDFKDVGFNKLLTKPYSIDKIRKIINEFA